MVPAGIAAELAATLGSEEAAAQLAEIVGKAKAAFEEHLFEEQSALVEGLVRAYTRRRLRPLLEQYEVLEVEREGSWCLSQWHINKGTCPNCGAFAVVPDANFSRLLTCSECGWELARELWFMSRPDALLRERDSNELYLQSTKTTSKWDIRKERDAQRDMQGLSEGVEVEKRLGRWWEELQHYGPDLSAWASASDTTLAMVKYLGGLPSPPRIMGIRYEYMFKGDRYTDKELAMELGIEARSQRSHLIRGYLNPGMAAGDEQWNWSWDYLKEGGEKSKLYWKQWRSAPVWKHMTVKDWIDRLEASVETHGEENRALGYSGPAQATGFTEEHPLDSVFRAPIVVYRNDDDLRDWLEQTEAQERRVVEDVAAVEAAADEGKRRHLLNVHFPQTRRACEYPTTCSMVRICYGGDDIRRDPRGSGLYQLRVLNHPQELQK